jgi:adenosylmethionine---8-amino-7-oxononanoate aminotransferase
VGFGRTGSLFACDQAGITPDFLCLSKGITGGYLPLSVTMMTDAIYRDFYCDYREGKSFLDSHSYTGNTLACATANATLDLLEKEEVAERNMLLSLMMKANLAETKTLPHVKEVRQRGMIAAIELEGFDPERRVNLEIYRFALKHGVLLRPLGNVIYFMPPYTTTLDELHRILHVAMEAIRSVA